MRLEERDIPPLHPAATLHDPKAVTTPAKLVILQAQFNQTITSRLTNGAAEAASLAKVPSIEVIQVPGALELPVILRYLARKSGWSGLQSPLIVVTGCVIRGDTDHYHHVCTESISGVQRVAVEHCLPLGNAILTVENEKQAWDRCVPGSENKGYQAAEAALALYHLMGSASSGGSKITGFAAS